MLAAANEKHIFTVLFTTTNLAWHINTLQVQSLVDPGPFVSLWFQH